MHNTNFIIFSSILNSAIQMDINDISNSKTSKNFYNVYKSAQWRFIWRSESWSFISFLNIHIHIHITQLKTDDVVSSSYVIVSPISMFWSSRVMWPPFDAKSWERRGRCFCAVNIQRSALATLFQRFTGRCRVRCYWDSDWSPAGACLSAGAVIRWARGCRSVMVGCWVAGMD